MSSLQNEVLVVDDESSIRRALHATLSTLGFDIEEASGGEQAVLFVRTERNGTMPLYWTSIYQGWAASKLVGRSADCPPGFLS
jgi:CheY-like chemotaxis protein